MAKSKIKIGSRGSPLALKQVEEIYSLFKREGVYFDSEVFKYATRGDVDKVTALSTNPADNFFTDTLDTALLKKEIDLAIHSAKDLPKILPKGLETFALTSCLDETDCLIANMKLSEMNPGAKIGTSSALRSSQLKVLNPNVQLVDIRGTINERIELIRQKKLDGIIVATCALKRLHLENLITEIMPWETTPLQGQLAITGRSGDEELKEMCAALDVRRKYGEVLLVGAGPGDPQLITLKAIKSLERTDCVFYDFLVHKDILKYAANAEQIYVGKRKGEHSLPQEELSRMLRKKAVAGKDVVRLKGGDPLVFGRGADEINYLRDYHITVKIIPGISSATGIPSALGIPLTARGVSSSVVFLSAHQEDENRLQNDPIPIPAAQTIVFFMGLTKLSTILKSLLLAKWDVNTPVMIISKGTTPEQKIINGTIATIEKLNETQQLSPPALIIVGKTISFFQDHSSMDVEVKKGDNIQEAPPEKNPKILYLGTNPSKYQSMGNILHHPMIEITEFFFTDAMSEEILNDLKETEIIIFTSRFAVKYFMNILEQQEYSIKNLEKIDCVVIGKDTALSLSDYKITPAVISSVETSQGLLNAMAQKYNVLGKKILFPRSSLPNPYLKEQLERRGAQVKEWIVYQNTKPAQQNRLADVMTRDIEAVLFTSPSTVKNFLEIYGDIPRNWRILSKGSHTSKMLKDAGYASEVMADESVPAIKK